MKCPNCGTTIREQSAKPKRPTDFERGEVMAVVAHYTVYHPRAVAPSETSKEYRAVLARLREGMTVEAAKAAIDGMHRTPHNMGINERGQKYLGLELCFRSMDQVVRFIEAPMTPAPMTTKTNTTALALSARQQERERRRMELEMAQKKRIAE